ncbi:hypothetical protein HYFRA_00010877 [Hymenoscyphus fraxineus]|uniref:F-box domain-containing protein n=1 Tax=Hymenoscyphus fraxineus TaxID=746836 RepID=A0A9N9PNT8_9HELO|nr:hypothetical protein HYFRA_00010877 [Hymenoscyphus fraxineus]
MADPKPRKLSLTSRLLSSLRSKKSPNKIRNPSWASSSEAGSERGPLSANSITSGVSKMSFGDEEEVFIDIQTGERRDDTEMLHSLAHHGSFGSLKSENEQRFGEDSIPGEKLFERLPEGVWGCVIGYLGMSDLAAFAFCCKTFRGRLGREVWPILNEPENRDEKLQFLVKLDSSLPNHLLCSLCAIYHRRIRIGDEKLKATHVINPIFNCPYANEPTELPIRARLVPGHRLPFTFVQLALRALNYGPQYGIPYSKLDRRLKDKESDWTHQIRYYHHKGHLLLRATSKTFAAPGLTLSGQRHLLYSREDYTPYFSVCTHWQNGLLMDLCKCALSHIPIPVDPITSQLKRGPQITLSRPAKAIVTLCGKCRPMRRCPSCPTEYLIEIRLDEDRSEPNPVARFKQTIVVTRWSDLGDGTTPMGSREWMAINGVGEFEGLDSVGKRGISGTFESQNGVAIPGQRMLNLNPKNKTDGEEGDDWY